MDELITAYQPAIVALIVLTFIVLFQSFLGAYFGFVKGGMTPGAPVSGGHGDLSFRALRCYQNGVENLPAFAVAVVAAILVGANAGLVNLLAISHVVLRIVFAGIYFAGFGKPAGGPRSIIYVLGWLVNIAIVVLALSAAL